MMILENSSVASTAVSKTHGATEAKECANVIKLKKEGFKVRYSISCTKKKKKKFRRHDSQSLSSRMPKYFKNRSPSAGC